MMSVVGISGSLRAASYSTALVELVDLRLPPFDEDLEVQGLPAGVEQSFGRSVRRTAC